MATWFDFNLFVNNYDIFSNGFKNNFTMTNSEEEPEIVADIPYVELESERIK